MVSFKSQCLFCVHYNDKVFVPMTCKAFPSEIPQDILMNNVLHDHKIQGDNGIQFEVKSGKGKEWKSTKEIIEAK